MDCGSRSFLGSQSQLRLLLNRVRRVPKRVLPERIGSSSVARMICSQGFVLHGFSAADLGRGQAGVSFAASAEAISKNFFCRIRRWRS